jgi:hypothetical protein
MKSLILLALGATSASAFLQHGYCSSFTEDEVWTVETRLACSSAKGKLFGSVCTLDTPTKMAKFSSACYGVDKDTCFAQLGNESPKKPPKCSFSGKCYLGKGNCS